MVNISGMISGMKQKVRERQKRKDLAAANSLADLRKERIAAEGRKKIYDIQAKERAALAKAKADVKKARFENSFFGKTQRAASVIKKNLDEHKAKVGKKERVSFLPDSKDHPLFRK